MRREEITVTITPDGRATVAVKGVGGPRCEELTAVLEQALGLLQKRQRTGEYYRGPQAGTTSIQQT
jgi:hypothetical protein